ncbi:MAG: DUF3592 domain-containing protein [Flavobacteriia bacterium]|nr:DUF3592 domain-containing protein [Flavobacteriia bacterium]
MNAYRNVSYVGFVLLFIGLVLFGYGIYNLNIEKELDKVGVSTKGMVYELETIEPYKRAWVKFADQKGDTIRFLDKLYWNKSFEKYTIGQEVEVLYNPNDPMQTATINDFFQRNTAPWWPVVLGGIVSLIGLLLRRRMLKKAKKFDESYKKYNQ